MAERHLPGAKFHEACKTRGEKRKKSILNWSPLEALQSVPSGDQNICHFAIKQNVTSKMFSF